MLTGYVSRVTIRAMTLYDSLAFPIATLTFEDLEFVEQVLEEPLKPWVQRLLERMATPSRAPITVARDDSIAELAVEDDAWREMARLSIVLDEQRAELVAAGLEYVDGYVDGNLMRMAVPKRPPVPGDGEATYSDYLAQTRDQERRDRQRFTGAD